MKKNIKKFLLSTVAVLLVMALSAAGTLAYLQSTSPEVKNTFNTNKVKVGLEEEGTRQYNIIPGTSEAKKATVTVDNTVDAYVYVQITDTTEGLVNWAPADGWTLLDGTTDVYYREVAENATENAFSVLKDDVVSYDASLTNEDMKKVEGKNPNLTFKAFAIQKTPFDDPACAWTQIPAQVANEAELQNALDNAFPGKPIQLTAPVKATEPLQVTKPGTVLDMNGQTIAPADGKDLWNEGAYDWSLLSVSGPDAELTINGNGKFAAKENDSYAVDVRGGAKLTINGGEFVGNVHAVYVEKGELTVNGGKFSVQQKYPQDPSKPYEFTLNCYDKNYNNGTAKILVKGGSFYEFDPTNCAAEGAKTNFTPYGYTAERGEDGYYTVKAGVIEDVGDINDALKGVQGGGTIVLNQDIEFIPGTVNFQPTEAKKVTLDLNGHKITKARRSENYIVNAEAAPGSEIIIKNGELNNNWWGMCVGDGVKVTLENVKLTSLNWTFASDGNNEIVLRNCEITATDPDAWALTLDGGNNNLTIEDTVINADGGVAQNGSHAPVTINLRNSTINAGSIGVYVSNSLANNAYQTLNIDNCTIKGWTAVEVKHTKATITNSTLTATATEKHAWEYGSGSCTRGYGLAVSSNSKDEPATGTVTVTGGDVGDVFVFGEDANVTVDGTKPASSTYYDGPFPG